jgi:hypothetical protein
MVNHLRLFLEGYCSIYGVKNERSKLSNRRQKRTLVVFNTRMG